MKTRCSIRGVAFLLGVGLTLTGCATSNTASQDQGSQLTGSYLPQQVEKNGPVTNGRSNVRVIDRTELNSSGGGDVNESLRNLGVSH